MRAPHGRRGATLGPPTRAPPGARRPPVLLYAVSYRDPRHLKPKGLRNDAEPFWLYPDLAMAEAARRSHPSRPAWVLVLDRDALALHSEDPPVVKRIPRAAVLNVDVDGDFWRPFPVVAAGGYVVRRTKKGNLKVLLIHRRGKWDLPKGKMDPGETPLQAALREVSEEVGVKRKRLRLLHPLGHTLHGYAWHKKGVYAVKTTHWFSMATEAREFVPEIGEGIDRVAWKRWDKAAAKLGFRTLREHLASLDPAALGV